MSIASRRWSQLAYWLGKFRKSGSSSPPKLFFRNMDGQKHQARIKRPFTVIVEGNIGSGKTTFLNYFSKFKDVEVLQEPVNRWRDVQGHNLLGLLYNDPNRWSLAFQTHVQLTMLDYHTKDTKANVKLMERSIYSGRYCFVENLYQSGFMEAAEHAVLSEWFKWIVSNAEVGVDLIVYLRSEPETVHKRIMERARKEEKTVPLSYIQALHQIHEDWLHRKTSHPVPAPVLEIDANVDLAEMLRQISSIETQILNRKVVKEPFDSGISPVKLRPPSANVTVAE